MGDTMVAMGATGEDMDIGTASALLMPSPRLRLLPMGDTMVAMGATGEDMDIGTASALLMLSPRPRQLLSTTMGDTDTTHTPMDTPTTASVPLRLSPLPIGDTTEATMVAMVATGEGTDITASAPPRERPRPTPRLTPPSSTTPTPTPTSTRPPTPTPVTRTSTTVNSTPRP